MAYMAKSGRFEAYQWFKNGDHPEDRCSVRYDLRGRKIVGEGHVVKHFEDPVIPGFSECLICGNKISEHGAIDKGSYVRRVCPGDWIVKLEEGNYQPIDPDTFAILFEEITE